MKANISSSNQVYNELKKEIMFLELFPGQAVNEVSTANRFNVSRTPIRDAFKRLESDGLIEVQRGHGTFVSLIDVDEIDDIMYIREKLETSVVKEITALSKSQEILLEIQISKQRELLEQDLDDFTLSKKFLELDNDYHETIFTLANKQNIWKRISQDRPHYNRIRVLTNFYSKDELIRLFKEHEQIKDCIINHNFENIDEIYKSHIYRGMQNIYEIVKNNSEYFIGRLSE